jgi:hypothetical protein
MGPKWEKSWQYLVCPHFVQNGPSEELPIQLFKWRLLQATKVLGDRKQNHPEMSYV